MSGSRPECPTCGAYFDRAGYADGPTCWAQACSCPLVVAQLLDGSTVVASRDGGPERRFQ